jgi:hypothetical protein
MGSSMSSSAQSAARSNPQNKRPSTPLCRLTNSIQLCTTSLPFVDDECSVFAVQYNGVAYTTHCEAQETPCNVRFFMVHTVSNGPDVSFNSRRTLMINVGRCLHSGKLHVTVGATKDSVFLYEYMVFADVSEVNRANMEEWAGSEKGCSSLLAKWILEGSCN